MRKMAFMGAGIAHTAFGGIALGILLGIEPLYTSMIFCVFAALFIRHMTRYGHISYDAGIGIFFAFSMALGAILIAIRKAYTFDLAGYLFGNILGVTGFDLILVLILTLIFFPVFILHLNRLLFMTFDEDGAKVSGVNTGFLDSFLLISMAIIVVISIKIVGIILVSALIVLPASFGILISRNYRTVLFVSVIYTLLIMIVGLFLSAYMDLPTGATMVVIGTIIYFLGIAIQRIIFVK
jgi:ABC-type Mn2+/Zn2+ transport system permease subunit